MAWTLATRASELALWQARSVQAALANMGLQAVLQPVQSDGDLNLEAPLSSMGGVGIFTKVLDEALLRGDARLAVHSLKDLPTTSPHGLSLAAVLPRGPVADALIAPRGLAFLDRPAVMATGSPRRAAQWQQRYPHHRCTNLRGNVHTRLQKIADPAVDAGILAEAGLVRLNLQHHMAQRLHWMLPAPGQGAVAVVCRTDDAEALHVLQAINHAPTRVAVEAERHFLRLLEAGCSAPLGALAEVQGNQLQLQARVLDPDGQHSVEVEGLGQAQDPLALANRLAEQALARGAASLLPREV